MNSAGMRLCEKALQDFNQDKPEGLRIRAQKSGRFAGGSDHYSESA
jgi:hypothetical protein